MLAVGLPDKTRTKLAGVSSKRPGRYETRSLIYEREIQELLFNKRGRLLLGECRFFQSVIGQRATVRTDTRQFIYQNCAITPPPSPAVPPRATEHEQKGQHKAPSEYLRSTLRLLSQSPMFQERL